ncbi:MAG TPA: molybdenum cofactor biosynthesis protein MoaE [Anaeromyxobacteraceae bacterium]|nr:molybdenum cofactor biosynthesis protein MoaE [Anaeromyxobacteraceae bacterium]
MPIKILYFAAARDAAGLDGETVPGPYADVTALRADLAARHPRLAKVLPRCRFAVNEEFADDSSPVPDGAEVALVPPVAGGAGVFRVVDRPLSVDEVLRAVESPGRGGVVTFTGTVRDETHGRRVLRLHYEAYVPMAERVLARIGAELEQRHGATVAIVHRVGTLEPGEAAVVIACAAPHRAAAFRACEQAIEQLKADAPIWKREVFEDGSVWVGMGP